MKVIVRRKLLSGKSVNQLVDMKPKLFQYLSKEKRKGSLKRNKSIKKTGILDVKKYNPKSKFGDVWDFSPLTNDNDDDKPKNSFSKSRKKRRRSRRKKFV